MDEAMVPAAMHVITAGVSYVGHHASVGNDWVSRMQALRSGFIYYLHYEVALNGRLSTTWE